jgi:hypothetical protein
MSDAFFDPNAYMGQVSGYDIGSQPSIAPPTTQAFNYNPEISGTVAQYAPETALQAPTYMPTFDFSAFQFPQTSYTPQQAPQVPAFTTQNFNFVPASTAPAATAKAPAFVIPGTDQMVPAATAPATIDQSRAAFGPDATAADAGAAPQDKGNFLQSLLGKGFSLNDALKLALGIGGGIMGMSSQKKAADEAAAAEAEYKAAAQQAAQQYQGLAQPYLTAGGSQLSMALQGSLAPAQMQQFQAAQAQLAQGAERTGGVGAIQSTAALQNLYQQALQNQQNMALQLLGPGNTLASNAINTELQGTQGGLKLGLDLATQANQASQNMYSAIASMIGGQRPSPQTATS